MYNKPETIGNCYSIVFKLILFVMLLSYAKIHPLSFCAFLELTWRAALEVSRISSAAHHSPDFVRFSAFGAVNGDGRFRGPTVLIVYIYVGCGLNKFGYLEKSY